MMEVRNGNGNGNGNGKKDTGIFIWLAGVTLSVVFGSGVLFERVSNTRDIFFDQNKILREQIEIQRLQIENLRIDTETLKAKNERRVH